MPAKYLLSHEALVREHLGIYALNMEENVTFVLVADTTKIRKKKKFAEHSMKQRSLTFKTSTYFENTCRVDMFCNADKAGHKIYI